MTDRTEEGHHDDCEDCKRERKENQQYIAVYERLQALRKNVEKTSSGVKTHAEEVKAVRKLSQSLDAHLIKVVKSQSEADSRTIQTVGFEIASVMAEKIARSRLQADNEYLRKRIQRMRSEAEERPCSLPRISETKYGFNQTKSGLAAGRECQNRRPAQMEQSNASGWGKAEDDCDSCSTKFSFFKKTGLNASAYRDRYRGLKLWLYEGEKAKEGEEANEAVVRAVVGKARRHP